MLIVSAIELGRNLKRYEDIAQIQPVFVHSAERPQTVLLSAQTYRRLKALNGEPVEDNDNQDCAQSS